MSFDAAILTVPTSPVAADVVIELPNGAPGALGRVTSGAKSEPVTLQTPAQLLSLLDRLCPTSVPRNAVFGGVSE